MTDYLTDPSASNYLATMGNNPAPVAAAPVSAPPQRISFLDSLRKIGEGLMMAGGPMGQEMLQNQQTHAMNMQKSQMGMDAAQNEINDQATQKIMTAVPALEAAYTQGGAPAVQAAWGQMASLLNIAPDKANQFNQMLQSDPEGTIRQMKAMIPKAAQGSLPASIQETNYLASLTPEQLAALPPMAQERIKAMANPNAMEPAQYANFSLNRDKFRYDRESDARKYALDERKVVLDERKAAAGEGNPLGLSKTQYGVVVQKSRLLPVLEAQLNRVETLAREMEQEGTLARGSIGGLLPGAVAGPKAAAYDKALGAFRQTITGFTRTPGVGSMSDYESALAEMPLPSRWGPDEGRKESLRGYRTYIDGLKAGYTEMLGSAALSAPRAPSAAPRPAAPRATGGRAPPAGATRTATGPNGAKKALVNGAWVDY